jgi:hypothetical protein
MAHSREQQPLTKEDPPQEQGTQGVEDRWEYINPEW